MSTQILSSSHIPPVTTNCESSGITHHFIISGHEGYITVVLGADGQPIEIFITMSKIGSMLTGMMTAYAGVVSIALRYGAPLKDICSAGFLMRFEPDGPTGDEDIPHAFSIVDYICRWLKLRFVDEQTTLSISASTLGKR